MSPLPDIVPNLCDAIVLQLHFLEHVPAFPQKIAATDDNSALREDMRALEPEEENAQPRTLRWVPLGFLGKIGPGHHADSWHLSLWQTFFCSTVGERVPVLLTLHTQSHPGATCGCSKFLLDSHGDHVSTCKSHSGAAKSHDWMVAQLGPLFGTTGVTAV